ncbi:hypothetical protein FRC02_004677 [Tulasnella sp. 418]|nr:hypothetical protein FRC02_004677 [Tulasnella sp. 418]
MFTPQPPDRYGNNKRQRSLDTSAQIPGFIQPSGTRANKRPRPGSYFTDAHDVIADAPGDLVARLAELGQQRSGLGMPIGTFCSAIVRVRELVSTINNEGHKATIEEIGDLRDHLTLRIIRSIEEGKATNMIENEVRALTRALEGIVTDYDEKSAETRRYPELVENMTTSFLESTARLLYQSPVTATLDDAAEPDRIIEDTSNLAAISRHTADTLEIVQHINARSIAIEQRISSRDPRQLEATHSLPTASYRPDCQ